MPSGLWAPSSSVIGSSSITSRRPGTSDLGRRRGHRRGVELAQIGLRGGPGQREVPPLVGAERAQRHARVGAGANDPRAALAGHPLGDRVGVGVQAVTEHQHAAGADHVELLGGDRGDRRAEPAGVLEAHAGQHLHLGRGSRWSRRSGRPARPRSPPPRRPGEPAPSRRRRSGARTGSPGRHRPASGRPVRRRARRAGPRRRTAPARDRRRRPGSARRTRPDGATGRRRCAGRAG